MSICGIRSERQITDGWLSDGEPLVSVCCITFNHARYIEDFMRGVLSQETDFPFELVIHDDASMDGTREIVRRYADDYPRIVKPILQRTNTYSIQTNRPLLTALGHCSGEFVAFCEGDDYWTRPDKLQRQVTLMRARPNCDISFHPAVQVCSASGAVDGIAAGFHGEAVRLFSSEAVARGGGGFMASASLMFRSRICSALPPWFADAPVGDYFLQSVGALRGGALYFPDRAAAYRVGVDGGWSSGLIVEDVRVKRVKRTVEYLQKHAHFLGPSLAPFVRSVRFRVAMGFVLDLGVRRKRKRECIRESSWTQWESLALSAALLLPETSLRWVRTLLTVLERRFPEIRKRIRS